MKNIDYMNEYRQTINSAASFMLFAKTESCPIFERLLSQYEEFKEGLNV